MTIHKTIAGEGQDVVLIHGWGGDLTFMEPIEQYLLKKNYRITNIDLPGSGASDWVDSISTIHDFADAILPELPEKAIYIAWSFGGLVAMSIASRFPEKVERIIGIATTPRFVEDEGWPGLPKPGFVTGVETIPEVGFVNFLGGFYEEEFKDFVEKPAAYHHLVANLTDWEDFPVLLQGTKICDDTDLRKELSELCCPVDFILGDQDGTIPPATYAGIQALGNHINLQIINNGKHMPFWTHPEEVFAAINNVLNKG